MSGATTTEPHARAGRGWGAAIALAVATLILSVLQPVLLIFVPLAVLLVALPPRRPALLLTAGALVWLFFFRGPNGALWYVERGWALLLAAWFLAFAVIWPQRSFIARGLSAVAATTVTAALLLLLPQAGFDQLDDVVNDQLRGLASETLGALTAALGFDRVSARMSTAVYAAADLQTLVFPALVGLGSLAGLAAAWFAYRRVVHGDAAPLGSLREFRFPDDLVWVLIAGMALLLLPLGAVAERAGTNLLAFMAALYALRGLAVLLVVAGAPGPLGIVVGGLLLLFLYPLVMATTVVVGVTDTWLDIRARRTA
ncbi:MAG: DUF2232 domain-containing protein, partial [Longimicrobiales bacterium]